MDKNGIFDCEKLIKWYHECICSVDMENDHYHSNLFNQNIEILSSLKQN